MLKMDPRVLQARARQALRPVMQPGVATSVPRYPYGLLGLLDGVIPGLPRIAHPYCLLLLPSHAPGSVLEYMSTLSPWLRGGEPIPSRTCGL